MKSKTSFFNFMIFKKDITRFWPLWVLELLFLQCVFTLPMYSNMVSLETYGWADGEHTDLKQMLRDEMIDNMPVFGCSVFIALFAIVVAIAIFSYLTKEREAYTMHSFPVKRGGIFFSHYLAGVVILLAPYVLTCGVALVMSASNGLGLTPEIFVYLLEIVIQILFFFSLACFVVMLTGNGIMTATIYVVLNILYVGVMTLYGYMGSLFVYGSNMFEKYSNILDNMDGVAMVLTPVYHLFLLVEESVDAYGMNSELIQICWDRVGVVALYLIPSLVLVVLSVYLYGKRQLEVAGDMVAFSWGKPAFRVVFCFCGSMLFASFLYSMMFASSVSCYAYRTIFRILLFLVVAGVILFYLVGNMILYKTFFIWKKTSYWRMGFLALLMVTGMFWVRNTQFGARLPDVKAVEKIKVTVYAENGSAAISHLDDRVTFFLEDAKAIKEFYQLNQKVLSKGRNMDIRVDEPVDTLDVVYYLEKEKMWSASYPLILNQDMVEEALEFLYSSEDTWKALLSSEHSGTTPDNITLYSNNYYYGADKYSNSSITTLSFDSEEEIEKIDRIRQGVMRDMQQGHYSLKKADEKDWMGSIELENFSYAERDNSVEVFLDVTKGCTETIAALKETGEDSFLAY